MLISLNNDVDEGVKKFISKNPEKNLFDLQWNMKEPKQLFFKVESLISYPNDWKPSLLNLLNNALLYREFSKT